jgi:hypothetical protein
MWNAILSHLLAMSVFFMQLVKKWDEGSEVQKNQNRGYNI